MKDLIDKQFPMNLHILETVKIEISLNPAKFMPMNIWGGGCQKIFNKMLYCISEIRINKAELKLKFL